MSFSARPWIWTLAVYIIKFYFRTHLACSPIKINVLTEIWGLSSSPLLLEAAFKPKIKC